MKSYFSLKASVENTSEFLIYVGESFRGSYFLSTIGFDELPPNMLIVQVILVSSQYLRTPVVWFAILYFSVPWSGLIRSFLVSVGISKAFHCICLDELQLFVFTLFHTLLPQILSTSDTNNQYTDVGFTDDVG